MHWDSAHIFILITPRTKDMMQMYYVLLFVGLNLYIYFPFRDLCMAAWKEALERARLLRGGDLQVYQFCTWQHIWHADYERHVGIILESSQDNWLDKKKTIGISSKSHIVSFLWKGGDGARLQRGGAKSPGQAINLFLVLLCLNLLPPIWLKSLGQWCFQTY